MKIAILLAMALVTISSSPLLRHGQAAGALQSAAPRMVQSIEAPAMEEPAAAMVTSLHKAKRDTIASAARLSRLHAGTSPQVANR